MLSTILTGVLLALFAFVDVWYFVRAIKFVLERYVLSALRWGPRKQLSMEDVFAVSRVKGIVLPSDLDMMIHMNNSKYLRELDFGRFKLVTKLFYSSMLKLGRRTRLALTTINIRYRRSLLLWQRFTIETKILCWKDDGLYFEQRFVGSNDGFVYAIALVKFVVRGPESVTMQVVMETVVGGNISSPRPPPEVKGWMESITKSSEGLRMEK